MGLTVGLARIGASVIDRALRSRLLRPMWSGRFDVAVRAAHLLHRLDRRTDTRIDTTRAGRALLAAVPDAVERLRAEAIERCVLVSATNGKTTTVNMLASITREAGWPTIVNALGANMAGGICTELLVDRASSPRSQPARSVGVFEVDELWLDQMVAATRPDVIVLGNLHPDQLDRTGGPDRVAARWRDMVRSLPVEVTLVVNAADPMVLQVASDHPRVIRAGVVSEDEAVSEALEGGGPTVLASNLDLRGLAGVRFDLIAGEGDLPELGTTVAMGIPGRYNVANAILASGAATALGLDIDQIATGLARAPRAFGRVEPIAVDGRTVTMILAKNSPGMDEVLTMLAGEATAPTDAPGSPERGLDLIVFVNALQMDGTDVSWLRDVSFDVVAPHVASVTCAGSRPAEVADVVESGGVARDRIFHAPGAVEALEQALRVASADVVAITNYSAMLDLRETLAELGYVDRYWL